MKYDILSLFSDPAFRLQAFADYQNARFTEYQDRFNAITEVIAKIPDDPDATMPTKEQVAQEILSEHNLTGDELVGINGGYAKLRDMLEVAASDAIWDCSDIGAPVPAKVSLQVMHPNGLGEVLETIDADQMVEGLKDSMKSSIALVGATLAMKEATFADRLTVYRDSIRDIFNDAYSSTGNVISYFKGVLQRAVNADAFFTMVGGLLGVTAGSNEVFDFSNADIYDKVGSNPLSVTATNDAANRIGRGFEVAGKAIGAIFSGLWNIGGAILSKGSEMVSEAFSPTSVSFDEKGEAYSINGLGGCMKNNIQGSLSTLYYGTEQQATNPFMYLDPDKIYSFWTKLGYASFKIDGWDLTTNRYTASFWFQPFCISYHSYEAIRKKLNCINKASDEAWDYSSGAQTMNDQRWAELSSLVQTLSYQPVINQREGDNLLGFACATELFATILAVHNRWMRDYIRGNETGNYSVSLRDFSKVNWSTGDIGNSDFIKICTGWSQDKPTFDIGQYILDYSTRSVIASASGGRSTFILNSLVDAVCIQKKLQKDGLEFPFVPYSTDRQAPPTGKYNILSDEEEAEAMANLIIVAFVAVVTIAIGFTVAKLSSKLWRKNYAKRVSIVKDFEEYMANNPKDPLTGKDMRIYKRAKKKLSKMSANLTGLVSASAAAASAGTADFDVSDITAALISSGNEVNSKNFDTLGEVSGLTRDLSSAILIQ